jgi:hypothetical protein
MLGAARGKCVRREETTPFRTPGWRLASQRVRHLAGDGTLARGRANAFFTELYGTLAQAKLLAD